MLSEAELCKAYTCPDLNFERIGLMENNPASNAGVVVWRRGTPFVNLAPVMCFTADVRSHQS